MSNHKHSDKEDKSGYTLATPNLSKDNERYWMTRIFKHTRDNGKGIIIEDSSYSVRISYDGKRKAFQLGTANKKLAAQKARDIYRNLVANGWDNTLTEDSPTKSGTTTVGDVIRVYLEVTEASPKTSANYVRVFRTVVADIKNISGDKNRYDHVNGGAEKWRTKVDNILITDITQAKVQKWKVAYVKERSSDPVKKRSAMESANSYIRYCRSIFKPDLLTHMRAELSLPEELPFTSVKLYPRQNTRYISTFNIVDVMEKAKKELPNIEQDQQWLIFVLAISTGMRRNEIDKLTWRQINFDKNFINVSATEHLEVKGTEGIVDIEQELSTLLKGYYAKYKDAGDFVIQSDVQPAYKSKTPQYRANRHLQALVKWLRKSGVEYRKPIQTLRKEAGSEVCRRYGLHASSTFLRHADIQVTSNHYVENKQTITSGLASLLTDDVESIESGKEEAS